MLRQKKNVWLLLNQNETSMHNNALVLSWYLWKLRNKKIVMNINNTLMKNGSNDNDGRTTIETQNGLTPNLWCTCLLRRSSASIFFVVSAVIFILATVGDPFIDRLWWHTRCDHIKTLIPYALDARANNCDKRAILASSWAPNICLSRYILELKRACCRAAQPCMFVAAVRLTVGEVQRSQWITWSRKKNLEVERRGVAYVAQDAELLFEGI